MRITSILLTQRRLPNDGAVVLSDGHRLVVADLLAMPAIDPKATRPDACRNPILPRSGCSAGLPLWEQPNRGNAPVIRRSQRPRIPRARNEPGQFLLSAPGSFGSRRWPTSWRFVTNGRLIPLLAKAEVVRHACDPARSTQ